MEGEHQLLTNVMYTDLKKIKYVKYVEMHTILLF